MERAGVVGEHWCQIACICGSRKLHEEHASTYLGEQRLFCGGKCKSEFDEHPWVYTFYVFEPRTPAEKEIAIAKRA
ncbi:MAG TPA: hypothetical protein VI893_00055 [Thermoplasmata archaeon]|nr:hypothetical protein [Thermoplasmata archaeon]